MPNIQIKMNPVYIPYLNRDEKFQCYYGGAGSGKSRFICQKIVLTCLKEKRKFLVVRQTYASIRQSVFAELKTVISDMGLYDIVRIKGHDMVIIFPTGSEILFKGLDDIEKIKSISGITDVFIEEASEVLDISVYQQLVLRVRPNNCKPHFYLAWNPVSASHWLKNYIEKEIPKIDGFVLKTTYIDNHFLNEDYVASLEALKDTNPRMWRVYGLAEWGTMGKLVYPDNWDVVDFNQNEIIKAYPNARNICGMDFGFCVDVSAFCHLLVDEQSKQMWVCKELYQSGMLNNELAKWIIENGYSKATIIADSSEQKSIEEIRRHGVSRIRGAKKGCGSIGQGISRVSQFKIHIHPTCTAFQDEIMNYSYKKNKEGIYTQEPIDAYNHLMDSLRYALEDLKPQEITFTFMGSW